MLLEGKGQILVSLVLLQCLAQLLWQEQLRGDICQFLVPNVRISILSLEISHYMSLGGIQDLPPHHRSSEEEVITFPWSFAVQLSKVFCSDHVT